MKAGLERCKQQVSSRHSEKYERRVHNLEGLNVDISKKEIVKYYAMKVIKKRKLFERH